MHFCWEGVGGWKGKSFTHFLKTPSYTSNFSRFGYVVFWCEISIKREKEEKKCFNFNSKAHMTFSSFNLSPRIFSQLIMNSKPRWRIKKTFLWYWDQTKIKIYENISIFSLYSSSIGGKIVKFRNQPAWSLNPTPLLYYRNIWLCGISEIYENADFSYYTFLYIPLQYSDMDRKFEIETERYLRNAISFEFFVPIVLTS